MNNYDVVIIGAGGAGLYISQLLGKMKLKVLLVDSKKDLLNLSFHTLGSFAELRALDLSPEVVASEISECVFYSNDYHFSKISTAYIFDKTRLHQELINKAISNGVIIRTSTKIEGFNFDSSGILDSIEDSKGNKFYAKIFIDASGLAGVLSKRVGLQTSKMNIAVGLEYNAKYFGPQSQAHLFIGKAFQGGYGWIFPLGNQRAIVGYGTFQRESIINLRKKLLLALSAEPIKSLIERDNDKSYGGTIPITPVRTKFVHKNIVCLGDSVSQVNPVVGEGYRFIMQSAIIAAPYINASLQAGNLELLKGYEIEWKKKFGRAYAKAKFYQRVMGLISKSNTATNIVTCLIGKMDSKDFQKALSGDL